MIFKARTNPLAFFISRNRINGGIAMLIYSPINNETKDKAIEAWKLKVLRFPYNAPDMKYDVIRNKGYYTAHKCPTSI
jgi:hypothetical protein